MASLGHSLGIAFGIGVASLIGSVAQRARAEPRAENGSPQGRDSSALEHGHPAYEAAFGLLAGFADGDKYTRETDDVIVMDTTGWLSGGLHLSARATVLNDLAVGLRGELISDVLALSGELRVYPWRSSSFWLGLSGGAAAKSPESPNHGSPLWSPVFGGSLGKTWAFTDATGGAVAVQYARFFFKEKHAIPNIGNTAYMGPDQTVMLEFSLVLSGGAG